jgi:hypothetical protein
MSKTVIVARNYLKAAFEVVFVDRAPSGRMGDGRLAFYATLPQRVESFPVPAYETAR